VWLFQVCILLKCDEYASMDLRGASSARLISQRDSNCCRSCVTRLLPNHVATHPNVYKYINQVFIRLYQLTQYMRQTHTHTHTHTHTLHTRCWFKTPVGGVAAQSNVCKCVCVSARGGGGGGVREGGVGEWEGCARWCFGFRV
jgi:hypothetical protein